MTTNGRGGKRAKAGRKPIEDKKVPICVYAPLSTVDTIGMEKIKNMFLGILDVALEEIKKSPA